MIRVTNLAAAYDKAVNGDREERQYVAGTIVSALQKNGDVLDPATVTEDKPKDTLPNLASLSDLQLQIVTKAFINAGHNADKISVIKFVRAITCWGLKETKDYVETFPMFTPVRRF
jgi:ribosomal protein L7/L12